MKDFVAFASANVAQSNAIRCLCCKCRNVVFKTRDVVEFHLIKNGMNESYTIWTLHGEDMDTHEDLDCEDLDDVNAHEIAVNPKSR